MARVLATVFISLSLFSSRPLDLSRRDPLGERAQYILDKSAARTSSLILRGTAVSEVNQFLPDHVDGPSYNAELSYDFVVRIQGEYKGASNFVFPQSFFTPVFMEELRRTGTFSSADYKMKHQGFADARLANGRVYPHCDRVLIYDIKIPEESGLAEMAAAAAGLRTDGDDVKVEDLQMIALMHEGIPAMSAAQIDIIMTVKGIKIKIGLDLK